VQLYVAPVGEPAVGPVAFPHRPSAASNPLAPIGHHWQDATHISFGVLTGALYTHAVKLEGSLFNGRDPDADPHHLPADIEYARAVPSTPSALRVTVQGDVAWVVSTSEATGTFRGRAVSAVGAELMVLDRSAKGWRIRAIHWSSRRRTPG
jgi:hypothetical protein